MFPQSTVEEGTQIRVTERVSLDSVIVKLDDNPAEPFATWLRIFKAKIEIELNVPRVEVQQ